MRATSHFDWTFLVSLQYLGHGVQKGFGSTSHEGPVQTVEVAVYSEGFVFDNLFKAVFERESPIFPYKYRLDKKDRIWSPPASEKRNASRSCQSCPRISGLRGSADHDTSRACLAAAVIGLKSS